MSKSEGLNKYADTLADIFGVLFVLALGFLPFLYIAELFPKDASLIVFFVLLSLVVGFFSLIFLIAFNNKDARFEETKDEEVNYVLDKWRIGVLEAKDAPSDVISALEEIFKTKVKSKNVKKTYSKNELLGDLEEKLGKFRVREVEGLVLRYTLIKN